MSKETTLPLAVVASRVAMVGIIAALLLTIAGMTFRSPWLGGSALVVVLVAVVFREPIARLFVRR